MEKQKIVETNLQNTKHWQNIHFFDDDIVLSEEIAEAPIPKEAKRMNFILIALCQEGHAVCSIDTQEVTVNPGDLIMISDRHIVERFVPSADLKAQCIMLSKDFYYEFMKDITDLSSLLLFSLNNHVVSLTESEMTTFSNYYNFIKGKLENKGHHYRKKLVSTLLLAMFYDLSDLVYHTRKPTEHRVLRGSQLFTQFIHLLEANFRSERRVSWYAEQLCITPKYLSEAIKKVSKRTPYEWINSYVTRELRVLLKNTNMNIKEIAEALNFPNQSFLGKFFKEHVGMSPSEYRRS